MKFISKAFFVIFLACCPLILSGQGSGSRSIGFQLNPYMDENLFNWSFFRPVYAIRYSIGIKDRLTLGPEISGFHIKVRSTGYASGAFNAGAFARYSFLPGSRIRPFAELSAYYSYQYWKNLPEGAYTDLPQNGSRNYLTGYVAPGISLYSKSKKISLDLFYKFSDREFMNNKKSIFSYRLNFRF